MIMIFRYDNYNHSQVHPIRIVAVVYEAKVVSRVRHWDMNTITMTVETTQTLFSLMNTLTFDIVILYAYRCSYLWLAWTGENSEMFQVIYAVRSPTKDEFCN